MVDVQWLLDNEWHVVVCDTEDECRELFAAIEEAYPELEQDISLIPLYTDHYYRMRVVGSMRQICHGSMKFFYDQDIPDKDMRSFAEFCGDDTFGAEDPPIEWLLGLSN